MTIFIAMTAGGCNSLKTSGIDPTGEHVFSAPPSTYPPYPNPYQPPPPAPQPSDPVTLTLTPSVTSAPVGSEVLLIAGVVSADGHYRCNQRLEWFIAQGGVGQFIDIGKNDFVDILLGDYNRPRLVNAFFGIGSTASKDEQVKRGPPAQNEEIAILPGQGWIKITSPVEGISTVSVTAAKIANATERTKTASIYWTDVTWRFPPPAIDRAGAKHVFTTTVMRQTNQCPCPGWVVKYTITGGPPAGFSPDGASSIEATTDAAGQANAEIFQQTPAHGTNQISIEVIRPAELPGASGQRMTVGNGSTMQTWTAADIGLKMSGPSLAKTGETLNYRLDVSNPGDLPSKNIVVSNALPDGLGYLGSNPSAGMVGRQLQWRLGELGPRQHQVIEVSLRAEKEGSVSNCADVVSADGLKLSDCATTTITTAAPISGPSGAFPLPTNFQSVPGEAPKGYPGVRAPLGYAPRGYPGASAASQSPPMPSATSNLIDLQVLGPKVASIGSEAIFNIVITNRTQSNINKLIVKDRFDPGLEFQDSNKKVLKSPIDTDLGDLPPGRPNRFNLSFHVLQAGNLCHTIEVIRQGEVMARAQACVMVSGQAAQPPGIASPGGQIPPRSAAGATQGAAPGNRLQTPPGSTQSAAQNTMPSAGAAAPSVTIKQTGPKTSQHTVGDMVSFVSRIANPNNRALSNVKITYHFDPALVPKFATDHFRAENGNLAWSLPVLPAGGYTQIEVQYKCEKAASKAGNTVSVTSSEGAQAQDTAYLDIRPASGGAETGPSAPSGALPGATTPGGTVPGGTPWSARQKSGENQGGDNQSAAAPKTNQPSGPLTMTIAALHNPVAVGKELTYVIRVVNNTGLADREVTLTALVPDGMMPVPLGTKGPGSMQPDIDRQTVAFNLVVALQPGETLTYQVRVLAKSAGRPIFRAKLISQNYPQPIIQEAEIEVFEREGQKKDEG